jgi:hypothetical protein
MRQKGHEFQVSLDYIGRTCYKKTMKEGKKERKRKENSKYKENRN